MQLIIAHSPTFTVRSGSGCSDPVDGAAVVASLLCQVVSDVRQGCTVLTPFPQGSQGQLSVVARGGTSRLRDTIAWGYILGRHAEREPQVRLGFPSLQGGRWCFKPQG